MIEDKDEEIEEIEESHQSCAAGHLWDEECPECEVG